MRKRLYDFSKGTAIIVLVAYIIVFTISIYSLIQLEEPAWNNFIFVGILLISLIFLIIYYIILSIKVTDVDVNHFKKRIAKKDLKVFIRPNYRYRYNEIIFRDKNIKYDTMTKKEILRNEIAVQHLPKHEEFILNYLGVEELEFWGE